MPQQTQDSGNTPKPTRDQGLGTALVPGQCERDLILEAIRIYDEVCGTNMAKSYALGWSDHNKPLAELLQQASGRMEFRFGCSVKVLSGPDAGRIDRDAKLLIRKCTIDVGGVSTPGFMFDFDPNILVDHPDSAFEANKLKTSFSERLEQMLIAQGRAATVTNPWW